MGYLLILLPLDSSSFTTPLHSRSRCLHDEYFRRDCGTRERGQQQWPLFLAKQSNRRGKQATGGSKAPLRGGPKKSNKTNAKNNNKKSKSSSSSSPQLTAKAPPRPPAKKSKSPGGSTPPWQVLSTKDAKANIALEKLRRERARLGDHSTGDSEQQQQQRQQQTLSTAFLSQTEQQFLNWKRFNPVSDPSGMRFVGSFLDKRKLPPTLGVPEVAFLGRSNVGKSSLLNRLSATASGQRDEARVGKTPGATASVNLYALLGPAKKKGNNNNNNGDHKDILGWADLPGFGYAKLSKDTKESVQAAAENYLGKRRELCLGILLADIRREPSDDDRAVLAALYDLVVPLVVVATKIDKVSNNQRPACLETIRQGLGLPEGQPLAVSSTTGEGTRDLWRIILEACEEGVQSKKFKYDEELKQQALAEEEEEEEEIMIGEDIFVDDDDEIAYSQGYDWVHGESLYLEDDGDYVSGSDGYDEDGGDSVWDEYEDDDVEPAFQPRRENLKSLQKRAREMEKRGEL